MPNRTRALSKLSFVPRLALLALVLLGTVHACGLVICPAGAASPRNDLKRASDQRAAWLSADLATNPESRMKALLSENEEDNEEAPDALLERRASDRNPTFFRSIAERRSFAHRPTFAHYPLRC
jgi:hypothetical protein